MHVKNSCKLGCGAEIMGIELEEHLTECPKQTEKCEKCGLGIYVNVKGEPHDCKKALTAQFKINKVKLENLETDLGINYS